MRPRRARAGPGARPGRPPRACSYWHEGRSKGSSQPGASAYDGTAWVYSVYVYSIVKGKGISAWGASVDPASRCAVRRRHTGPRAVGSIPARGTNLFAPRVRDVVLLRDEL